MDRNQEGNKSANKWGSIDENILLKIFASLTVMELVFSVSWVCRSWRSTVDVHCSQLKKLNLKNVGKKSIIVSHEISWCNTSGEFAMFVRHLSNPIASTSNYENLTGLALDNTLFFSDSKLLYAAQRCPNLKNLELPSLPDIAEEQLAFAFRRWPKLESLAISFSTVEPSPILLQSIGQHCENIKSFRIRARHFFTETSSSITNFLPNLEILSFCSVIIQPQAIVHVLKNLPNLQEMYIAHKTYHHHTEGDRLSGIVISNFLTLLQNEEIVCEARRLRVFHVCKSVCCDKCDNKFDEIEFMSG